LPPLDVPEFSNAAAGCSVRCHGHAESAHRGRGALAGCTRDRFGDNSQLKSVFAAARNSGLPAPGTST